MCRSDMLRAGLIGFPASGKTALFQLLTSAREAPRAGGKTDANVGVSRVPDERLDKLTALFNPKKHTPATVEFADIGGAAAGKTGAAALLDVAPFRNADALLHVVRMFRDPSVPHAAGSVDPARDVRTMEEEVDLADLGVVERRLETTRARHQEAVGHRGAAEGAGDPAAVPGAARGRQAAPRDSSCRRKTHAGCAASSSSRRSRCSSC